MSVETDDWDDDSNAFSATRKQRARKEHRCICCREKIRPGDVYAREVLVFDGSPSTYKRCLRCQAMYDHLRKVVKPGDAVDMALDCGHEYEENFGKKPPPEVEELAFLTPDEAQQRFAKEEA